MRGFDDVLREGFDRHSRALTAAGGIGKERAQAVVGAIRRRRRIRAYTSGVGSVVAVAGLAVSASAVLPLHRQPTPVGPGAYPWCDLGTYPLPNPEALGGYFPYEGRVYADYDAMKFVYVAPDGSTRVLEPGPDGDYAVETPTGKVLRAHSPNGDQDFFFRQVAFDYQGSDWTFFPIGDGYGGARLGYEWTTVIPEDVPEGVSIGSLLQAHAFSLGFNAMGLSQSAVPQGAVVETVIRWTDGREQEVRIGWDSSGAGINDDAGIASVSIRVSSLPNGEVFEITSYYNPTMTWAAACEASPVVDPETAEFHWGPLFEGPESEVFSCLANLPVDAEDRIPATVETGVGEIVIEELPGYFSFGAGGAMITSTHPLYFMEDDPVPSYPGWGASWTSEDDGSRFGAVTFDALAWVDGNGAIIGREVLEEDRPPVSDHGTDVTGYLGNENGREAMVAVRGDLAARGVSCDGVDASALEGASIVFIQGFGPSADEMTWSWTRLTESS